MLFLEEIAVFSFRVETKRITHIPPALSISFEQKVDFFLLSVFFRIKKTVYKPGTVR